MRLCVCAHGCAGKQQEEGGQRPEAGLRGGSVRGKEEGRVVKEEEDDDVLKEEKQMIPFSLKKPPG